MSLDYLCDLGAVVFISLLNAHMGWKRHHFNPDWPCNLSSLLL
jgi:hypothetical protein